MLVGDIMTRALVTVGPDATVGEVQRLFEARRFHHALVVACGHLIGVVSDRDLLGHLSPFIGNALAERPQDLELLRRRVHLVMSRRPVTVAADTPVGAAAWLMRQKGVSCLPVVEGDSKPVGIVTARDLLTVLCQLLPPQTGRSWTREMPAVRLPSGGP